MGEEFTVKCVRPLEGLDENKPVSGVQTAYNVMQENGFKPLWVDLPQCLEVKQKERNCVYLIEEFEGEAFNHLKTVGCRVFGPQCVLSCLHLKVGIPKTGVPIYTLAMKDLTISCTSLDKATRENVMCKVQWMGGHVSKDFTDSVTHLVAGEVGSKKYTVAGSLGKHIMLPEWVDQVWAMGKHRHLHGTDEQFQKYKCPIFKNMIITVSGLDTQKRKQVQSIVQAEGGSYTGEMKVNECTHLIINQPKGQKYEFARKWKIQVVSLRWLQESVEKGYSLDEDGYRVESSATQPPQVQTSTPDRERKSTVQRLSIMGDISSISHLPDLTHLNETTLMNATRQSTDEGDSLLDLNLTKISPDLFLDGCRIYLSGFRGPHMEKLKKIINLGGATRFNQINDSVSHVIMGEKIEEDLKTLKQANFRPHIVSTAWLVDSLKQGKLLDELPYSRVELPPLDASLPEAKIIKRPSVERTAAPNPSQNNNTEAEDLEMAELMSQYMREQGNQENQLQDNDQTVKPEDETIQAEAAEPNLDLTQQPGEEEEQTVFGGKKFVCFGFDEDNQAELAGYIEQYGGKVVSVPTRLVCDYAVVPIGGFPVPVTVTEVVTNAWLQMCLEQETLLPVDGNELFRPLEIAEESFPLEGCVVSISGFGGTERDCLMHISEVLGARCQEYFVRKANKGLSASTHLITKTAGGSKYSAARKWKLPAVSKRWLFACARSGRREPEQSYLVDENLETAQPCEEVCAKGQNSVNNELNVSHHTEAKEQAKTNTDDGNNIENNLTNKMDVSRRCLGGVSSTKTKTKRSVVKTEGATAPSDEPQSDVPKQIGGTMPASEHKQLQNGDQSETEEEEGSPSHPTQVSPPGSCSQKENIAHTTVTPSMNKPQHGRVKELLHTGQLGPASKTLASPGSRGIDTPGKFLNPQKIYFTKLDANDMLAEVQSPVTNTPGSKKTNHRRRSSLALDDALVLNMAKGIENSLKPLEKSVYRADQDGEGGDRRETVFIPLEEKPEPLRDVVIAVSKKLSLNQAEYNKIAASLGADYRWTYDSSCTHFIFQGRINDINKEFRTARDHGKIIVSPHWLTLCKEQNARVDESMFPHNYNPNLSLSVVTSKRDTPARATRKSTRSSTPAKLQATGVEIAGGRARKRERIKSDILQDKPLPLEPEPVEPAERVEENLDLNPIPALETGGTLEIREAFSKEIESILATTKTKKSARRKSRRLNSSGQLEGETPSSAESVNRSRQSASLKQPDLPGKQSEHVQSEPSQSVQVTWDDETARLEQERLALELQRAHSPTQCTQPIGEEFGDNAQYSDTDDSLEVQINLKHGSETKTEKTGELRTPTPEPPTLGFPTAAANQTEAEPIELIKEDTEEKADVPPRDPPVFMVSGMQQQERDDYGALVEQLGGRMLEGQHYHASCTHLVVANPTRNEKFMACVASGKWVLHKSYFEACRQEGRFVEEEVHEWGSDGTRSILASCSDLTAKLAVAAHRWRIRVQDNLKASKTCRGAFEDWNVVLCTDKNKEENFKRLLEAGGAQVASIRPPFTSSIEATHAFLELHKISLSQEDLERLLQSGVKCVKPDYIAAFLTHDPSPNPDEFCPTDVMALRASMSVPEQGVRKRKSSSVSDGGKRSRRQ